MVCYLVNIGRGQGQFVDNLDLTRHLLCHWWRSRQSWTHVSSVLHSRWGRHWREFLGRRKLKGIILFKRKIFHTMYWKPDLSISTLNLVWLAKASTVRDLWYRHRRCSVKLDFSIVMFLWIIPWHQHFLYLKISAKISLVLYSNNYIPLRISDICI